MNDAASPTVRDNIGQKRFEIDLGDSTFAIAEYTLSDGKIVFTHTKVPPSHEGQGHGTRLIEAALASAREKHLKVVPSCRFFADYIARHDEVHDLLDDSWQTRFGLA